MRKPIPGPKWEGRRSRNCRSPHDLSIDGDAVGYMGGRAGGEVQADPESSEAEMMEREREAGFIVVDDGKGLRRERTGEVLVCSIQPSHSWQNESDALGPV